MKLHDFFFFLKPFTYLCFSIGTVFCDDHAPELDLQTEAIELFHVGNVILDYKLHSYYASLQHECESSCYAFQSFIIDDRMKKAMNI